jgi:hypothetical protein
LILFFLRRGRGRRRGGYGNSIMVGREEDEAGLSGRRRKKKLVFRCRERMDRLSGSLKNRKCHGLALRN